MFETLCQCTQRAYFHFYISEKKNVVFLAECVNALNGLTSISTYLVETRNTMYIVCQCPQRAYFHFYGSLSEPLILLASESYFYK